MRRASGEAAAGGEERRGSKRNRASSRRQRPAFRKGVYRKKILWRLFGERFIDPGLHPPYLIKYAPGALLKQATLRPFRFPKML